METIENEFNKKIETDHIYAIFTDCLKSRGFTDRNLKIVRKYIDVNDGSTVEELAQEYDLTRRRIKQIIRKAVGIARRCDMIESILLGTDYKTYMPRFN